MLEILKFSLSGIFNFIGVYALLYILLYFSTNLILRIWSRLMRMIMVNKHGWPPSHLDADGDWKQENK